MMNTENKTVQSTTDPAIDQICRQRLLSPDFAKPQKTNYMILKYLRSFKRR